MTEAGIAPDKVHTSLQTRAIRTANLALDEMGLLWVPVQRHWRLNERHYGDLTGRNKAEATAQFGEDQVKVWRRSYDTPPPPIAADNAHNPNADARYASIPSDVLPQSECLADVVDRMLPYWFDVIVPDLAGGRTVLVAAHGNSLRALVKHLDGISDDEIAGLDIPTGVPLVYELDDDARPVDAKPALERALGDPEAIAAAAAAVAAQATKGA
jgi:2,3-bisphosphoglycerate-dependent phosphoglycerate mutase